MLQSPKHMICNSPIGTCQRLQKHPYLPLTFQTPSDVLDHMARAAEQRVRHSRLAAEPSVLKTSSFLGHFVNGLKLHTQMKNILLPKSKEALKVLCFLFGCRRGQMQFKESWSTSWRTECLYNLFRILLHRRFV